jgi:hypothetical protein
MASRTRKHASGQSSRKSIPEHSASLDDIKTFFEPKFKELETNILRRVQQLEEHIEKQIDTQVGSIKTLFENEVLNEGNRLEKGEMRRVVLDNNRFICKILFIMKYVVNTKQGVIVTWPFKVRDQLVFVTNTDLIKFVANNLFKKDFVGQSKELANIVHELDKAKIEVFTFKDIEDVFVNDALNIFPLQPLKTKTPNRWFGISAKNLSGLFVSLPNENSCPKSRISSELIKWSKKGMDEGLDETHFPEWRFSSRPKIYTSESLQRTADRIQWGVEIPIKFFSKQCYDAISQLAQNQQRLTEDIVHIGPGWFLSDINNLENYNNINFVVEPKLKIQRKRQSGSISSKKSRSKKPCISIEESHDEIHLSHASQPFTLIEPNEIGGEILPPPILPDNI